MLNGVIWGKINHPGGPFQFVVPVKEEPGDEEQSTFHFIEPPNPKKTGLEQKDHWLGRKFKCLPSPINGFNVFSPWNPLSSVYQKELLMRTLKTHWDRNLAAAESWTTPEMWKLIAASIRKWTTHWLLWHSHVTKLWLRSAELERNFTSRWEQRDLMEIQALMFSPHSICITLEEESA